jgi:hypothetical protein
MKICDAVLVIDMPISYVGQGIAIGITLHTPDPGRNRQCGCGTRQGND